MHCKFLGENLNTQLRVWMGSCSWNYWFLYTVALFTIQEPQQRDVCPQTPTEAVHTPQIERSGAMKPSFAQFLKHHRWFCNTSSENQSLFQASLLIPQKDWNNFLCRTHLLQEQPPPLCSTILICILCSIFLLQHGWHLLKFMFAV